MTKETQIEEMPRQQVYELYRQKKRNCRTVAQEVECITSDPEMILIRERLLRDNGERKADI